MGVRHFRKKIVFIIAALGVVFLIYFLLVEKGELVPLLRSQIKVKNKNSHNNITLKFNNYYVIQSGNHVSIKFRKNKYKKQITFKGELLNSGEDSGASHVVKIVHGLSGKYIMDFNYFFPLTENPEIEAALFIMSPEGDKQIKIADLVKEDRLNRLQIPVKIKKDSTLAFQMKGKGIVILGQPVFYKKNDYGEKPLVFVISVDTMRYDHLGIYNHKSRCSPNIDRFARDAVVFQNAYSSSSWTLPAHVSLFTGLYANCHKFNFQEKDKIKPMSHTLFKLLAQKYLTISFNGGVFLSKKFGFNIGFDIYQEARDDCHNPDSARNMFQNVWSYADLDHYNLPLLFFLHTYQVHSPFCPEDALAEQYFGNHRCKYDSFEILELTEKGKKRYRNDISQQEKQEIINVYNAGIYTFDTRFGEFIQELKRRKLYHRSMICLLSDHGEEFMDHGGWEHGHSLYNELVKIPLLVKFPYDMHAGEKVREVVSIADVLPTIIETSKIEMPENLNIHGLSLYSTLNRKKKNGDRQVVAYLAPYACSRTPTKTAVIDRDYKLIFNKPMTQEDLTFFTFPPPRPQPFELYYFPEDPNESKNVKDKHQKQYSQLMRTLSRLKRKDSTYRFPKSLHKELKTLGYISD